MPKQAPVSPFYLALLIPCLACPKDKDADTDKPKPTVVVDADEHEIDLGQSTRVTAEINLPPELQEEALWYRWVVDENGQLASTELQEIPDDIEFELDNIVTAVKDAPIDFRLELVDGDGEVVAMDNDRIEVDADTSICGNEDLPEPAITALSSPNGPPGFQLQLDAENFPAGFLDFQVYLEAPDERRIPAQLLTAPNDLSRLTIEVPTGEGNAMVPPADVKLWDFPDWDIYVEYCTTLPEPKRTDSLAFEANTLHRVVKVTAPDSLPVEGSGNITIEHEGFPLAPMQVVIIPPAGADDVHEVDPVSNPTELSAAVTCPAQAGTHTWRVRLGDAALNVTEDVAFDITCT